MKLSTDIRPRTDGKVVASTGGGAYVFARDADSGQLTCDVSNEKHAAYLLDTGNFYPTDIGDIPAGLAAVEMHGDAVTEAVSPAIGNPKQGKAAGGKRKAV